VKETLPQPTAPLFWRAIALPARIAENTTSTNKIIITFIRINTPLFKLTVCRTISGIA
jgi:hypothetical protein